MKRQSSHFTPVSLIKHQHNKWTSLEKSKSNIRLNFIYIFHNAVTFHCWPPLCLPPTISIENQYRCNWGEVCLNWYRIDSWQDLILHLHVQAVVESIWKESFKNDICILSANYLLFSYLKKKLSVSFAFCPCLLFISA